MSESQNVQHHTPIFTGGLIGAVVGLCLMSFSFLVAFSICGDTMYVELLFPYALLVDPTLDRKMLLVLLLALPQYPLYGVIVGFVFKSNHRSTAAALKCALVMLAGHAIAVGMAKYMVSLM